MSSNQPQVAAEDETEAGTSSIDSTNHNDDSGNSSDDLEPNVTNTPPTAPPSTGEPSSDEQADDEAGGNSGGASGTDGQAAGNSDAGTSTGGNANGAQGGEDGQATGGQAAGGSGAGQAAGGSGGEVNDSCDPEPLIQANAKWRGFNAATVGVACSASYDFFLEPWAGVADAHFDSGARCGACIEVVARGHTVVLPVIDRCTGCVEPDEISLSPSAFKLFEQESRQRFPVSWRSVPCAPTGGVWVTILAGSNRFSARFRFENLTRPIARAELKNADNISMPLTRNRRGVWLAESPGVGPYELALSDKEDETIGVQIAPLGSAKLTNNRIQKFAEQLPTCD